jgi:hypothetical protein
VFSARRFWQEPFTTVIIKLFNGRKPFPVTAAAAVVRHAEARAVRVPVTAAEARAAAAAAAAAAGAIKGLLTQSRETAKFFRAVKSRIRPKFPLRPCAFALS